MWISLGTIILVPQTWWLELQQPYWQLSQSQQPHILLVTWKKKPKTCNCDFCNLQLHTSLLNIDLNTIFPAQDLFFSRGKIRSFSDLQILGTFTTEVCFPARHTAKVLWTIKRWISNFILHYESCDWEKVVIITETKVVG